MKKQTEAKEQIALMLWLQLQHPDIYELTHHSPNGGYRNAAEAYKFKCMGVKKGYPDITIALPRKPYHGIYIELKTKSGKSTQSQNEWIGRLRAQGYKAEIAIGWEIAKDIIDEYLKLEDWE